jgi:hypothetical protein
MIDSHGGPIPFFVFLVLFPFGGAESLPMSIVPRELMGPNKEEIPSQ